MKKFIKNIINTLAILLCIVVSDLSASHVAGGQLTYKCLGNGTFEIILEFRRDCFNGDPLAQFDDPVSIGIFDDAGNLVSTIGNSGELLIPYNDDDTLNEILTSECRVLGEDVCVQVTEYRKSIDLPFREGGYTLAYQRCCRNGSLTNIVDPTFQGSTYMVTISEDSWENCNSSAQFISWPSVYLCANQEIEFDHSAIDPDGDSLVYSLCLPYVGATSDLPQPAPPASPPYGTVLWAAGYDLNNLMGGDPLTIDPVTGMLTGNPNATGQFLVGVCVEEYRDGVLINKTIRDFEYNVRICLENPLAEILSNTNQNCEGLDIEFMIGEAEHQEQIWYFDYPDNTLSSIENNPTFTFPESGTYNVALFVADEECQDSAFTTISVSVPEETQAAFSVDYIDCRDDLLIYIDSEMTSVLPIVSETWTVVGPNTDLTITGQLDSLELPLSGTYVITWTLENEVGCLTVVEETLDFQLVDDDPSATFTTSYVDCLASLTIFFETDIQSVYDIITEEWTIVGPNTDLTLSGPLDTLPVPGGSGSYTISLYLENEVGCSSEIIEVVDFLLTPIDFEIDVEEYAVCSGSTLVLNPNADPTYTYLWESNPPGLVLTPDAASPEVVLTEEAEFYVTAFLGNCSGSDTVTVIPQSVEIEILDTIEDQYYYCEDGNLTVGIDADGFENISWYDGNGDILGTGSPFTFSPDGPQTLTVIGSDALMCADTATIEIDPYMYTGEIVGDDLICLDEETSLSVVNDADPLQTFVYNWEPSELVSGINTESAIVFEPTVSSDVFVTVTNQFGCTYFLDYFVEVDQFSEIDAVAEPNDIVLLETTQLTVTEVPGATYEWSPPGTLSDPTIFNPIATPDEDGIVYTIIITNENGCVAFDTVSVSVVLPICDEDDVFVPNMFTPNGDGFNDVFKPESNFIDEMQLIVYNRWGEEVFVTDDPTGGWDGTFDNETLEPDVYGYHLSVLCINGATYVKQGNVTLVK